MTYASLNDPAYSELETALKETRLLETAIDALNEGLMLPEDISALISECGEGNAFYDPASRQAVVFYELLDLLAEDFAPFVTSLEELDFAIVSTVLFIFCHEIGHALVDVLDLPITGREEDAVD